MAMHAQMLSRCPSSVTQPARLVRVVSGECVADLLVTLASHAVTQPPQLSCHHQMWSTDKHHACLSQRGSAKDQQCASGDHHTIKTMLGGQQSQKFSTVTWHSNERATVESEKGRQDTGGCCLGIARYKADHCSATILYHVSCWRETGKVNVQHEPRPSDTWLRLGLNHFHW